MRRLEGDQARYDGAEVRLVMTPSCDLLRRGAGETPAAKTVLFLPGTLRSVREEEKKKSDLRTRIL